MKQAERPTVYSSASSPKNIIAAAQFNHMISKTCKKAETQSLKKQQASLCVETFFGDKN